MGDDNKMEKEEVGKVTPARQNVFDWAQNQRDILSGSQTGTEQEFIPFSQGFQNRAVDAANRQMGDYGNIMQGYQDWQSGTANPLMQRISARPAPNFSFERIGYNRDPSTIGNAITGYNEFAQTGGYSPDDVRDIRARGISPIRTAYANAMQNINRQRTLQGGYSPNYTAATESMQRMLPQQLSDATQSVNARLAEAIRQGRLAGMSGLTGIGGMEAGHRMSADQANQAMNLRTQELAEQGRAGKEAREIQAANLGLQGLAGQTSIYGTTPAAASTFGNQAMDAYRQRLAQDQLRFQTGMGLAGTQLEALGNQRQPGKPWWQTAFDMGTSILPFL
jgi:hypothetical protein